MVKGLEKLVADGHSKLVPLNFFNARIAPFKKPKENTTYVHSTKCLLIGDNNYSTQLFHKNITLNLHE